MSHQTNETKETKEINPHYALGYLNGYMEVRLGKKCTRKTRDLVTSHPLLAFNALSSIWFYQAPVSELPKLADMVDACQKIVHNPYLVDSTTRWPDANEATKYLFGIFQGHAEARK